MQIIIKSTHFKASEHLEKFTRKKIERLENLNDRIVRAHVTLSLESESDPENKSCEILLSIPGEDPYLKKSAATFEEAVAMATEAMEKVLRRKKER